MKTYFLTALSILCNLTLSAQTADSLKRKLRITEATLIIGSSGRSVSHLSLEDYRLMIPSSVILDNAVITSSGDPINKVFGPSVSTVGMNLGLCPKSGTGTVRLGVLYQGAGMVSSFYHETLNSGTFDTLTSAATGETFMVDSTRRETYFVDTRMEHIGLDVSMVFNTHYQRLNFFGGFGISGSASLNSKTFVSHVAMTEFEQDYATYTLQQNNVFETEIFKHKSTFQGQLYIPMGIDLTLGKKRPVFTHTSLHLELRPALKLQQIPNSSLQASVVSSSFLGLKYRL
jgi:hypothetical protein